ncbi:MAG: hypothetical protein RL748_4598 [Pseudomonadota bacterium]|jgi:uncharacterized membrane protein YqjE
MPFVTSLKRLFASLSAIFHNRLELATVEIEEASLRLQQSLILSLCALLCGTLAVVLLVVLCIVLFWEQHRIAVISGFMLLFAIACAVLINLVRQQNERKPRLLGATLDELRKDIEALQQTESSPPPSSGT